MSTPVTASPVRPVSPPSDRLVTWALPATTLVFFLVTARGYGIFRDELYYLACARHLDWGYVDHPPMVAVLAALARALFGTSLVGLRSFPALAAAGTVALVGATARVMGGGVFARVVAQLLAATAPIYLSLFTIFSMNAFDVLIWAALAYLAARLLDGADPRLWLAFGALAGVGLQTKLDVGLLGVGLAAGLVLARRFDVLRGRWLYAGGALAAVLFAPHVLWQITHDWPTREFVANARSGKIVALAPWEFVLSQLETVGPAAGVLAFAGLGWLLLAGAAERFQALGWTVLVVLAVFAFSVSKPYYFAPAFTLLFPAAAVALASWMSRARRSAYRAGAVMLILSALLFAPLAKPLLPIESYQTWAAKLGVEPESDERHPLGRLPQFFADMHGWRELAETVASTVRALPPEDRTRTCVFGRNYGQAGAIDFFGPSLALPPAISGHNNFWLWGPGRCTGEVLLILGGAREEHEGKFERIEPGGPFRCDNCMPYESDLTIWIARGLKVPLAEAWARVKHFD